MCHSSWSTCAARRPPKVAGASGLRAGQHSSMLGCGRACGAVLSPAESPPALHMVRASCGRYQIFFSVPGRNLPRFLQIHGRRAYTPKPQDLDLNISFKASL